VGLSTSLLAGALAFGLGAPPLHAQEVAPSLGEQELGAVPTGLTYKINMPSVASTALAAGHAIPGQEQSPKRVQEQDPYSTTARSRDPGADGRDVSWKKLPGNILQDQKDIWLFPTQLVRGRHWIPTIAVVGVTAGLIAADPYDMRYFRRTTDFRDFSRVLGGRNTGIIEAAVPGALYVGGLLLHNSYASKTALLAGEAYADSAIPHMVIKLASRRLRPINVAAKHDLSGTFFQSHVSVFGKGSSFPSGHAAGAFSIATVIARRYRDHRWVPWVAYTAAVAISFSRVPTLAHFPSDAFLGAALGYTIARHAVLRE
jgi:membrane-associated phospholipid phosphatase